MIRRTLNVALGSLFLLFGLALLAGIAWAIYDTGKWGYAGGGILALIAIAAGWTRLFPNAYEPLPIDPDDPLLVAATEQARREIGRFKRGLKDGGKEALVKFPAKTRSGTVEHIWAVVHSLDGERLTVSIANEATEPLENSAPRQTIRISDIEDWALIDANGATEGGYSHLAMARKLKREKGYLPSALRKQLQNFKDIDMSDL